MTQTDEPRRLRWSVPAADTSSNQWLDEQENISRSLQVLIRESIQRDGYVDVVNKPVDQLPRRGRPLGSGSEVDADAEADAVQPARQPTTEVISMEDGPDEQLRFDPLKLADDGKGKGETKTKVEPASAAVTPSTATATASVTATNDTPAEMSLLQRKKLERDQAAASEEDQAQAQPDEAEAPQPAQSTQMDMDAIFNHK